MDIRDLRSGERYDLAIRGPWGMRLDYLNVSYEGPITPSPTTPGDDQILLFWAEIDAKFGPIPVAALPTQVLAVKPR